jgi:pectate lyase
MVSDRRPPLSGSDPPSLERVRRVLLGSLGVPLVLWTLAVLFKLRVAGVFQTVLMKRFPGPAATYGAMLLFPVLAVAAGIVLLRRGRGRRLGLLGILGGASLVVLFSAVIGRAMVARWWGATPLNPPVPRPVEPQAGLPVFPGAEGFGTRTPGGRRGKVIEVTTLADSGPGSLRAAVADPAPRTVVFRVGGTIVLKDLLVIAHPFVTIAGHSAPGAGICLKDAGLVVATNDVLIQHLRIRPGREGSIRPEDNDAIALLGRHGKTSGAHHVVIDHVSLSWSEDEVASVWFGAHDITFSHCIISEPLNRSRHEKNTHGAGLLIGDGSYHVTTHHCLLAHNDFRNPLIASGGTHDLVNNVVYDWGDLPAEIYDIHANTFLNFVGNSFLPGPSSVARRHEIFINPTRERGSGRPRIFVEGNIGPHRQGAGEDEWSVVGYGFSGRVPAPRELRHPKPFPTPSVTASDALTAEADVLAGAGATRPERDAVDQRIVLEVRGRSGRIIDSPGDVGGYPALASGTPPADADHDGMPDEWERLHALDPEKASDAIADKDGDGYTNVEEYLFSRLK